MFGDFYDYCTDPKADSLSLRSFSTYNSERGVYFPTKGTYRMLVVFVNIIYDVNPSLAPNVVNNWGWNVNNQEGINILPPIQYFDDVFDTNNTLPRKGFFTRFMSECSFDSLVILGDFTSVEIKESRILSTTGSGEYRFMNSVIKYINNNGGLNARYGHNNIGDYDNATYNSTNDVVRASNSALDYVAFIVQNPIETVAGVSIGSGSTLVGGLSYNLKLSDGDFPIENWQVLSIGHLHIKHEGDGFIHEFAHSLLGNNSFHTSGGNHLKTTDINTFIYKQYGYGLFNNALRSCNAYERWRLGWQHPSNGSNKIAANGSNSDISKFTGTQTYYLRDFVTYGDAIRIQLPYKDNPASSFQYIWLENHQMGRNGKLDGLNYYFFPGKDCMPLGNPGIYSYIQVGKDVLESTTPGLVYPSDETDNLRMINAEGNYNMLYIGKNRDCVNWGDRPTFEYLTPNPLSGGNDQTEAIITTNQTLQKFSDYTYVGNKIKNKVLYNQMVWLGDNLDGFESGSVMDISSNPTPINAYTHYAKYHLEWSTDNTLVNVYKKTDDSRDTRKKYLTGLSIKMNYAYTLGDGTEVFKVDICWDDYDVKQDVNWAGDIVLKEQLNLLAEKIIYLEQNLTACQMDRDLVSGFFAPPTKFTCETGSVFTMNPNSKTILKDKSSFILSTGSTLTIQDEAQVIVEPGATFVIKQDANLIIQGNGQLIIEEGAFLDVEEGAEIQLQNSNSIRCPYFKDNFTIKMY